MAKFDSLNGYAPLTPMVEDEQLDPQDSQPFIPILHSYYQSTIEMLLYLIHESPLDLNFTIITLRQFSSKPRMIHQEGVK